MRTDRRTGGGHTDMMKLTLFFVILLTRLTRANKLLWLALKIMPPAFLGCVAVVHLNATGSERAHII